MKLDSGFSKLVHCSPLSVRISEYCVNMTPWRPWGPWKGLFRRAASLLGWKSSLSQLLIVSNFQKKIIIIETKVFLLVKKKLF